jgi:putative transposase
MAISFKGAHFPQEIILTGVRWYVAYPLSYRHVEELMAERGVAVDHATIQRWVVKYSPLLEAAFHRRKRPVWVSWRMDETYIRVKGEWKYLYRVVDKYGQTIDFLLTEHRDKDAALRFLKKAIRRNGVPETITIDGSDANEAAIKSYNQEYGTAIAIRQVKYFNNIVEIVFTQLIKMSGLTTGRGWNDVAYLHLTMVDEHTIDQEFSQGAPLRKCGLSSSTPDTLPKCRAGRHHACQLALAIDLGLQLRFLGCQGLLFLGEVLAPPLIRG